MYSTLLAATFLALSIGTAIAGEGNGDPFPQRLVGFPQTHVVGRSAGSAVPPREVASPDAPAVAAMAQAASRRNR